MKNKIIGNSLKERMDFHRQDEIVKGLIPKKKELPPPICRNHPEQQWWRAPWGWVCGICHPEPNARV